MNPPDFLADADALVAHAHARALCASGDDDAALGHLLQALTLDPLHAGAATGLGQIYQRRRQWDIALYAFQHGIRLDPNNTAALLGEAETFFQMGWLPQAEVSFVALLTRSPRHIDGLVGLGALRVLQGHLGAALPVFEAACEAAPRQWRVWSGHGFAQLR